MPRKVIKSEVSSEEMEVDEASAEIKGGVPGSDELMKKRNSSTRETRPAIWIH